MPETEATLAVRTCFSNEPAWNGLRAAIQNPDAEFSANVQFINNREYEGLTAKALLPLVSSHSNACALIVDEVALSNPEYPILAVDLQEEPGRTFRVIASALWEVENNLSTANMGFSEFLEAAGADGIFRGLI